ncbi:MAG: hypothetical protein QOI46_1458 [Alphaproteobacteria bacterium]|nr:hypothetical protein [Alphaproteobacteria bacterium]
MAPFRVTEPSPRIYVEGCINIFEETPVFRWAVICLIISLLAGGLGLTNVSAFAKRLSMIFFALFFLGFLALLGFAYLLGSALSHAELVPALVMISV